MNILFLTLLKIDTLNERGIYHDLMREFASHGHNVYIVSPTERREKKPSSLTKEENVHFLNVRTLNVQKTNIFEKGIATLSIEPLFFRGVKKYFSNVKFDLVLYSTPPITFTKVIKYIKKKDGARSYLLLKDIFPQNAVDMKMMSQTGLIYRFFRYKEKELYRVSDVIGCMSEANRQYLYQHNPGIEKGKVEVNPNSIEPVTATEYSAERKAEIKKRYQIPEDRKVFLYGGNLGIPQGIDFLLDTIAATAQNPGMFFVIVGSGTEYERIKQWFAAKRPQNALLIYGLPKAEYDDLCKIADVGMVFLHQDFTIPNFPSRLLSYLENKLPVLVAADPNTDIGTEVEAHGCGISVLSGDLPAMTAALNEFCRLDSEKFEALRIKSREYLENNFLVSQAYTKIIEKVK